MNLSMKATLLRLTAVLFATASLATMRLPAADPKPATPTGQQPSDGGRVPRGEFQPRVPRGDGDQPELRRGGDGQQRPFGRGGDGPGGQFQRPGMGAPIPNMTDEQREAFRGASEPFMEEMRELNQKMMETRRALQETIYAEKLDAETVGKRAAELGKLQASMTVIQAKIFAKVRPKLTSEQIGQMKNMPPMGPMQGRMGGPGQEGRPQGAPEGQEFRRLRDGGDAPGRRPEPREGEKKQ
jgi:Spy/CpxP family protein refolding chaperone